MRRERFGHDDDNFDALLSASQHEARQTRIGPLDIHRVQDGRRACPGGRRGSPDATPGTGAAPATSIDSAERLPSIVGAAMLRFASSAMANSAAMPGCPKTRPPKLRKSQSPRRIDASRYPSLGAVNRTAKKRFAESFAILENAALSVRSNIMDMADVSGIKIVRHVQEDNKAASE